MRAILRSINNFSCKLKQSNNLKYNISPKIRSNKFKNISGNGNIVIEDAIDKNAKDYKIYGNTYQNSTRGINLYNYKSSDLDNNIDNLTVSLDKDGYLIINGTNNINYRTPIRGIDITDLLEDGQKYTIYQEDITPSDITNNFSKVEVRVVRTKPNGTIEYPRTNGKHTARITVDKTNYTKYEINVVLPQAGDTYSNYKNRFMLLKGSYNDDNVPSFEPYTNGPAPNPTFEEKIVSCGDRTKNLFDKDTTNVLNAYFDSSHINITADTTNKVIYLPCKPSTTYSITQGASSLSNHLLQIGTTNTKPEIGTTTYSFEDHRNDLTFTYTTNSTAKYIIIRLRNGDYTDSTYMSTVQLEEGSTATPYEPYYEGYKIPVNVRSDNLFDKDNFIDGYIDSSGVYHTDSSIKANALSDYIKIDNNTDYIFSAKNNIYGLNFALYDSNKVFIKRVTSNNTSYNQINSETANYCRVWCNISQQTNITSELIEQYEIQLKKSSSKPSKYIPYYNETTNIYLDEPLRKIDGYNDYIDFINGKVVRNIKEIILDGGENWVTASAGQNAVRFVWNTYQGAKIPSSTNTVGAILSNKFIPRTANETANKKDGIAIAESGKFVIYYESFKENTSTQFKTWLSSNNVTVDYVLRTPIEEDIELPNINLIEGKNIITIGTEVKGVFEVEYYSKEIIDISNYKYNLRKVED